MPAAVTRRLVRNPHSCARNPPSREPSGVSPMPTNVIVAAARPCIPSGVTACRTAMTVTFTNWPPVPNTKLTARSTGTVTAEEPCSAGTHRNAPSPSAAADTSTAP